MTRAQSEPPTGTVTFLFTDIEGSTRLLQQLGDRYRDLIEAHNGLLRAAFRDGYISGIEGDAFFVVFGSARAAVDAAVEAQRSLGGASWPDGVTVKVRMGLHSGEGVLAGGEYAGIDVNRAARIAAAAHGGEILVSDSTRALVGSEPAEGVRLRDLGEHRLKDLDRPERLHRLLVDGLAQDFPPPRTLDLKVGNLSSDLSPFIGREDVLREVRALTHDHRLVTLTGLGGSGKTRLSLQLAQEAQATCPDGAYFVELAPIVDPELVPDAIAKALDVMGEVGRTMLETVRDHLAGERIFTGKGQCGVCHIPQTAFMDNNMHDLKLERFYKIGQVENGFVTLPDGAIKTFTLRGIKDSPPYMHDGRLMTLADTVEFFNLVLGLELTEDEKRSLVAYMLAL